MSRTLGCLALMILLVGCSSTYYAAWEKLGWAKRDILVDRVKDARDDQQAAKEQFASALEQFQSVMNFEGGDLQAKYDKLSKAYERSADRAEAVSDRIESVEKVAKDLFAEWEQELKQYESDKLRAASEKQLDETKEKYGVLISRMKAAESKMAPVLAVFKDQVLFLKHNLNAAAIASLQDTALEIEGDVAQLIKEMEASINEANAFIDEMSKAPAAG